MPIASPFHERTSQLCSSMAWKDWGGYYAVRRYDFSHEPEYYAFRHTAGMIDVTPLFKYEVYGPDAGRFLARVIAKDVRKLKQGQVTYCCWCGDDGKLIDDGTVTRMEEDYYRVTAAEPSLHWFHQYSRGYRVTIEDSTEKLAALAVQGPYSRDILKACTDVKMDDLKFFRMAKGKMDGFDVWVSRTGYTGDLGYEVWTDRSHALKMWDHLMAVGEPNYGLVPAGLDAMDVTRIEAGFIMNGVDYWSANHCLVDSRKSTPFEVGLGWTVQLDREPFNGQAALKQEKARGSQWGFAGLVVDWDELESLYREHGLPASLCSEAWRTPVPVYDFSMKQIGYATSGAWSPLLKKNLALASLRADQCKPGTQVKFEVTVEFERRVVTATVNPTPFFNPERKRV